MKRLQNRIAESRWALPITAAYGLLVCVAAGLITDGLWLQFCLLLVTTMMMAELNNTYALIRIFSRMVSCSFLVLTTMSLFVFRDLGVDVVQLCGVAFLLLIFRAYQNPTATGWVFYAFCAFSVSSIEFSQMLLFLPLWWIAMAIYVQCFSARTLIASILGLLMPYWFVAAWFIYTGQADVLTAHILSIFQFQTPFDFTIISFHQLLTFIFVFLLAVIGSVHFLMYSYQDRIRIRMCYEMFMFLDAACFIFAIVQPQNFNALFGMSIVLTAPLIGHYLALSNSKASNITSLILAAMALALTVFNLSV